MKNNSLWAPLDTANSSRISIISANHIYLYDNHKRKYIDANSGLWNVSLGYGNKCIENAIIEQMKKLSYLNCCEFVNENAIELSDLLINESHENIDKIYFTCTGSEAIELAIKLIRKYQALKFNFKKDTIAIIQHSYHGNFYGSMSCSSYEKHLTNGYGPLLNGFYELTLPFCRCCKINELSQQCEEKMLNKLKIELEKISKNLAGIIIEPILGSAGVIPLPKRILKYIEAFSQENDIVLTFDEVATGFGRTGSMFYYSQVNVKPDIITMSKGINNGYLPFGALAISKKITSVFNKSKEVLFHLSTQNCNPICCASAIATMKLLRKNNYNVLEDVREKGYFFETILRKKLSSSKIVFDIRRKGLMIAIEYINVDGKQISKNELLYVLKQLRKKKMFTEWSYIEGITSSIVLFIPFVTTEEELITIANIICDVTNHL